MSFSATNFHSDEAKEELENEYNNITQGIIIRSRAESVEKSEKK